MTYRTKKFFNAKEQKSKRQFLRNNATPAERLLWEHLRKKQLSHFKFRRQHGIGPFIADFYCPEAKLVIEVDGGIHRSSEAKVYDARRDEFMRDHGISIIRFRNDEIYNSLELVLNVISTALRLKVQSRIPL